MFLNLSGFMQQRPKMAFWVSFTPSCDHAPRRLELPPLAVLELHETRHEGAAGEAVGSVQPPDPGTQHVPQKLEPLAAHALLYVHGKEGQGDGERPRRSAMFAVCGPYRPFPTFMRAGGAQSKWSCMFGGKS